MGLSEGLGVDAGVGFEVGYEKYTDQILVRFVSYK